MKTTLALLLMVLLSSGLAAQTVFQVPGYSIGNQIALTIANESPSDKLEGLTIKAVRHSQVVKMTTAIAMIKLLPPKAEADVVFRFDVGREAKINAKDTLLFQVSDKNGGNWSKSIIISFVPPTVFALEQNFPNPFNPSTTIYYQLPALARVSIRIYDILGREVRALIEEEQEAGYHQIPLDATNMASGAYFYRMEAYASNGSGSFREIRKLMVLK